MTSYSFEIYSGSNPIPQMSLSVLDNGDKLIDEQDSFFVRRRQDSAFHPLNSTEGLQLANYFQSSDFSSRAHEPIRFFSHPTPVRHDARCVSLLDLGLSERELSEVRSSASDWFMDGHLDPALLLGERVFTQQENGLWFSRLPQNLSLKSVAGVLTTQGGMHYADSSQVGHRILTLVLGIGYLRALYSASNMEMVWYSFGSNYGHHELGNELHRSRTLESLRQVSERTHQNRNTNYQTNLAMIERRREMAHNDFYFGMTRPWLAYACLKDPDFVAWMKQIFRSELGEYSLVRIFAEKFRESASALSGGLEFSFTGLRNLFTSGVIAVSSFRSIYDVTQLWFDHYGNLPYGSVENKLASAASSALSNAWLLAGAARQLQSLTGSNAFTFENFSRLQMPIANINLQFGDALRNFSRNFPVLSRFVRPFILPSLSEAAAQLNAAAASLRQSASHYENIQNLLRSSGASHFPYRFSLELRVALSRFSFANAQRHLVTANLEALAVTSHAPRAAALMEASVEALRAARAVSIFQNSAGLVAVTAEAAEGLAVGIEATTLPGAGILLGAGLAVGLGMGIGIAYATGLWSERFTPRDALHEIIFDIRNFLS